MTGIVRGLMCAAASVAAFACTDIFGASSVRVSPAIQELLLDNGFTRLAPGGVLEVQAIPDDTTFRLAAQQRVPVTVSTTSGDSEQIDLYRTFCPPRPRSGFYCFHFFFVMETGHSATEVASNVAAMGGRYNFTDHEVGGVTVFDSDDLVHRVRSAQDWPGVASVSLEFADCVDPFSPYCSLSSLTRPVPVDTGAIVIADGVLQIRSGDSVRVRYQQPTGGVVEATALVP